MQNAGHQYGQGAASSHPNSAQFMPPQVSPTTSSLRHFRKKDALESKGLAEHNNNVSLTENVARVAPHNHFPQRSNDFYRLSHITDYSLPPNPVKYSEIAEPQTHPHHMQHAEHLSVIQKPKSSKEFTDMCNMQQMHMKPNYPESHHNHQQSYASETLLHPHPHYLHKEPQQLVQPSYKTPESQYYSSKEHQLQYHNLQKYNLQPQRENDFLSKLTRLHPTMARSIMSDIHLREAPSGYSPSMDQSRLYQNQARYYGASGYPSNYPPMQMQHYRPPSCSYQSMARYPNLSPPSRRNSYQPDNLYQQQKNYAAHGAQPEYAQHYQHRRAPLPQEYYQQHSRMQYIGHQVSPESQPSENRAPVSENLKNFFETWADEEPQVEQAGTSAEAPVFMISGDSVQYVENAPPEGVAENLSGQFVVREDEPVAEDSMPAPSTSTSQDVAPKVVIHSNTVVQPPVKLAVVEEEAAIADNSETETAASVDGAVELPVNLNVDVAHSQNINMTYVDDENRLMCQNSEIIEESTPDSVSVQIIERSDKFIKHMPIIMETDADDEKSESSSDDGYENSEQTSSSSDEVDALNLVKEKPVEDDVQVREDEIEQNDSEIADKSTNDEVAPSSSDKEVAPSSSEKSNSSEINDGRPVEAEVVGGHLESEVKQAVEVKQSEAPVVKQVNRRSRRIFSVDDIIGTKLKEQKERRLTIQATQTFLVKEIEGYVGGDSVMAEPDEDDEVQTGSEDVQYRNAITVEENSVLLHIGGELVEININLVNGKKVITVVPISDSIQVENNEEENNTNNPSAIEGVAAVEAAVEAFVEDDLLLDTSNEVVLGEEVIEDEIELNFVNEESKVLSKAAKKAYDSDLVAPPLVEEEKEAVVVEGVVVDVVAPSTNEEQEVEVHSGVRATDLSESEVNPKSKSDAKPKSEAKPKTEVKSEVKSKDLNKSEVRLENVTKIEAKPHVESSKKEVSLEPKEKKLDSPKISKEKDIKSKTPRKSKDEDATAKLSPSIREKHKLSPVVKPPSPKKEPEKPKIEVKKAKPTPTKKEVPPVSKSKPKLNNSKRKLVPSKIDDELLPVKPKRPRKKSESLSTEKKTIKKPDLVKKKAKRASEEQIQCDKINSTEPSVPQSPPKSEVVPKVLAKSCEESDDYADFKSLVKARKRKLKLRQKLTNVPQETKKFRIPLLKAPSPEVSSKKDGACIDSTQKSAKKVTFAPPEEKPAEESTVTTTKCKKMAEEAERKRKLSLHEYNKRKRKCSSSESDKESSKSNNTKEEVINEEELTEIVVKKIEQTMREDVKSVSPPILEKPTSPIVVEEINFAPSIVEMPHLEVEPALSVVQKPKLSLKTNWDEESQSPKTYPQHSQPKNEKQLPEVLEFKPTKYLIDINELKMPDDVLQNYKEQVDSKLNSLSIQIPKLVKSPVRTFAISNAESAILMERFLKGEKMGEDDMKKIKQIIACKRLLQESRPQIEPLHLKKVACKRMKRRYRKLYAAESSDSDLESSSESESDFLGDYKVVQSNCSAGVPKLIIKRRTEMPQPIVRLERLDVSLLVNNKRKF